MALSPEAILAAFQKAGAVLVTPPSLMPADTLLDLYGEDIRARAYVTHDPVLGEQMLRPDFTVPIVQEHMNDGAEPARYCYQGTVWRKQDPTTARSNEYEQLGYELFDRKNAAQADAEVFKLFQSVLPEGLSVVTGDIGLLRAAVLGLKTSEPRRAALMRHLWRPERFQKLLNRFAGKGAALPHREALIEAAKGGVDRLIEEAGKHVGLRSVAEIGNRIDALRKDAGEVAISADDMAMIERLMDMSGTLGECRGKLADLAEEYPVLAEAVQQFMDRADALGAEACQFQGSFGLTNMEYYDGFVFGFQKGDTVVASGGRYDALTRVLGNGREIPAVGGVIRPELLGVAS